MAMAPRVVLASGGQRVDIGSVSPDRRGALRILAREAEAKFGMYPQSFNLFDPRGQVDSVEALRTALQTAGDGICEFEVRERPDFRWNKLRSMDAQIAALHKQGPEIEVAMRNMEERIMERVTASLSSMRDELRHTDEKVCQGLAPLVQSVALEQIDLKARLDKGIAPMVQTLAMEQIDAKAKLKAINVDALIGCMEAVAAKASATLETALEQSSLSQQENSAPKGVDNINSDVVTLAGLVADKEQILRTEIKSISERAQSAENDLKALQSQVDAIAQSATVEEVIKQPTSTGRSEARRENAARAPWEAEWLPSHTAAGLPLPYSGKSSSDTSMLGLGKRTRGDSMGRWSIPSQGTTAPFARQGARLGLGQRCQSVPTLAAVA